MKAVGEHLWNGAENGAKTFAILTEKATRRAEALGEDFSEGSVGREELRAINALNTAGNEAVKTVVGLVNANKSKDQPTADEGTTTLIIQGVRANG